MGNPVAIDDLAVSLFQETSIYSNVKMKADERHLKEFKLIQNHRKEIKKCKTEAV